MSDHRMKTQKGKVLPFEQSGEFFFKRGLDRLDRNNLLDAMAYYRKAVAKDPGNTEITLAIAETLTEMYRFEESNRLLFTTFRSDAERPSACYFGMGMNFLGLKEYDHARDSFEQYTEDEPEGEFIYDAYDMLDALDESFDEWGEDEKLAQDAQLARELLGHGDYPGAIRLLEGILDKDPLDADSRNDLALALYCAQDRRGAMEQIRLILADDPENIQAHCSMAVFLHDTKEYAAANEEGDFIAGVPAEDPEDLERMALSLMQLERYADALPVLERLFKIVPYDPEITHRLAQCLCRQGDYRRAAGYYERLLKIDPMDSVARYYRRVCRAAAISGVPARGVSIAYQVPIEEMVARVQKLNRYIGMEPEARKALWAEPGGEMEQLIRWGVQLGERSIKRAMLQLAATFGDARAELLLRDFLLQRAQPGDLKREALGQLKHMGAEEPYLGYLDGELIESRVSLVQLAEGGLPAAYAEVLDICMEGMNERTQLCMVEAANHWSEYVAFLTGYPPLTKPQMHALAAVLEYGACHRCKIRVTKAELCRKYGVTLLRFNNAMTKLMGNWLKPEPKDGAEDKDGKEGNEE